VPYRRKKLTFAISSPDEFLLVVAQRPMHFEQSVPCKTRRAFSRL